MALFDIDYNELIRIILPVRLRQAVQYAWLKALVAPVKYLYTLFTINRNNNLYLLSHNSQVCRMEGMLNDTFDPIDRGIYISDGTFYDPVYIYIVPEVKPVYIDLDSEIGMGVIVAPDPVPLYTAMETVGGYESFIVNVPVAVTFDTPRMKALIDLYRLPGRGYKIVTF